MSANKAKKHLINGFWISIFVIAFNLVFIGGAFLLTTLVGLVFDTTLLLILLTIGSIPISLIILGYSAQKQLKKK